MKNNLPLLSICIPTWNRSKFLRISLESFLEQIKDIDISELELYVSDNCSDDDTPNVVQEYIARKLPITYNRNETNIGAAGNFRKCMEWASGKYILLLGDDDILKPGAVKLILDVIRNNDYGLVHIHNYKKLYGQNVEYDDSSQFLKQISFLITFMSGSIFRKEIVPTIEYEKYSKTHLLQVPYYISSALSKKKNIIINQNIIVDGLDNANNGGYNFYEVFVENYLTIWKSYVNKGCIDESLFESIKKDIFVNFIENFNKRFFVYNQKIKDEKSCCSTGRDGFIITGANEILEKHYGGYLYYRVYKFKLYIWKLQKKILNRS